MAQNREQLKKLLQFIKLLIDEPGNEEFVKGLRELLDVPIIGATSNAKISDIEKYLGLDYWLDSATPDIDFSFVKEVFVREQLNSDYREMLRYRFGVRSHKIDFFEFCRYAMLQVEQLLNYYYQNAFESKETIVNYINNNSFATIETFETIRSLSLAIKLSAFSNKLEKRQHEALDFARLVRNEQSHRSPEMAKSIDAFRKKLLGLGLPLNKNGEVYWNGIQDDEVLLRRFNSIEKSEYWKYRYQLWRRREPFDEVMIAIRNMARIIETEINYKM